MRVAAVAFVLIVGAAVVLAFANTLNSWVLGGLLGGLAAILLCIPISLAIFTLLTRRHDARHRAAQALELAEEANYEDEVYDDELMAYETEEYALAAEEEELLRDPRARYLPANPRAPVSGYLPLPPIQQEQDFYENDDPELLTRRDLRNYPRQPRYPARSLARNDEIMPPAPTTGSTRRPATRSLAQHQSAALHKARQEAQQQQRRLTQKRDGSGSLSRRSQGSRSAFSQRSRTSRSLNARESTSDLYRSEDEYDTRHHSAPAAWNEDENYSSSLSTEELRERYPQYPRRPAYPRYPRAPRARAVDPWTGELANEDELEEEPRSRRTRRDPERLSGSLRNPLVRRAPYLYEDDPLNEEFARQLDNDHPITRRSSLYEHYRDDEV
jgi:hypothetical protein